MDSSTYRSLFVRFVHTVSVGLIRSLIILFLLLIIGQYVVLDADVRHWISRTYQLEGTATQEMD